MVTLQQYHFSVPVIFHSAKMSRVQLLNGARKALEKKGHLNAFISLKPIEEMFEEARLADTRAADSEWLLGKGRINLSI